MIIQESSVSLLPSVSTEQDIGFDRHADLALVPSDVLDMYEVHSWRNAVTVLKTAHEAEWDDILGVLRDFRLRKSHLVKRGEDGNETAKGGGRKSLIASSMDEHFGRLGWFETLFETKIEVRATREELIQQYGKRGQPLKHKRRERKCFQSFKYETPTHNVDCYKNSVALEVEWNNKNPFFDRDLNNFRLLFDLRVIEIGVIVTRCDELDEVFSSLLSREDARERYGATTTRMSKLLPLLKGGGGGGCPVLVFGIRKKLYDETG